MTALLTNVICQKQRRHQALVTKNASLIRNARLAVILKHGKAAVITGVSKTTG